MINREDFIFTIGYDGDSAVVDSKAKKRFGKLSTHELLDAGLYKSALCSAVYAGNEEEIEAVRVRYSRITGFDIANQDYLKLILGVQNVPENITKTTQI